MKIVAGLFIFVFGCLGAWLLTAFAAWSVLHAVALGIAGVALLLVGGVSGAIGALRKEVRLLPPG